MNELVSKTEYDGLTTDVQNKFQPAYYCTKAGDWGGKFYSAGNNYQAIDYCQLHEDERKYFKFNFDALELLGNDYTPYGPFDQNSITRLTNAGANLNNNVIYYDYHVGNNLPDEASRIYSKPANIDYKATVPEEYTAPVPEGYSDIIYKDGDIEKTLTAGTQLNQDEFVNLPNDRQHYAYFGLNDADLDSDGINYTTYIVTTTFDVAGTMYNAGMKVSESVYNDLGSTLQQNLKKVTITPGQFSSSPEGRGKFYYCIAEYKVGETDQ